MSASPADPVAPGLHRAARAHKARPATTVAGQRNRALMILIITVVVTAILPHILQYLNAEHVPESVYISAPRSTLSLVAIKVLSAALLMVGAFTFLMRGHPNRDVYSAFILLVGLAFPFIMSFDTVGTEDIVRLTLAAAVVLAVWNIGAHVTALKWVAISGSMIGAVSIIGVLIAPESMLYTKGNQTTLIFDWQLAGPFAHSNLLGVYCALALALTPLIVSTRWRILHGLVLFATIVASASRICVVVAGVLVLWWIFCRFRSGIAVRRAGTALICFCAAGVVVLPFLNWNDDAFTGRGTIWRGSLGAWRESPLVGLGLNWFRSSAANAVFKTTQGSWSPPHGHNLTVDALVKSGLVGLCILVLVLWAAIRATRAIDVSRDQIACFGYLIVFLVISMTEAIWIPPTMQMFPVVGLVFAVVIFARYDVQDTEHSAVIERPWERCIR
jgi:O-antigen ligase